MNKKIIIGICILAFLIPNVFALNVDISVKNSFIDGERLSFDYTISSDENLEVTYTPSIMCVGNPVAYLIEETISLGEGELFSGHYVDFIVSDRIRPGNCIASIGIKSPVELVESREFVIDTKPVLEIFIKTCEDRNCDVPKKVFLQGETVYIQVDDGNSNLLDVDSYLSFSDNVASVSANEIGYNSIPILVSSSNYKNAVKKKVEFSVISEHAIVSLKDYSVADKPSKSPVGSNVLLLVGLFVLIAGIVYYLKSNRKF
jgi:hypothetical protein